MNFEVQRKKKATAIELQESNKIIQVEEERTWKLCQQNNNRVTFTKQKRIATPPPKEKHPQKQVEQKSKTFRLKTQSHTKDSFSNI